MHIAYHVWRRWAVPILLLSLALLLAVWIITVAIRPRYSTVLVVDDKFTPLIAAYFSATVNCFLFGVGVS